MILTDPGSQSTPMSDLNRSGSRIDTEKDLSERSTSLVAEDELLRTAPIASMIRRMDLRILPIMSLLYLASFLDRTNIGNAKIA